MTTNNEGIGLDLNTAYWLGSVGNDADTLTVLHSYAIPRGVLVRAGDSISLEYFGLFDSAATAELSIRFAGGTVFSQGAPLAAPSGRPWVIRGRIVKVDSGSAWGIMTFTGISSSEAAVSLGQELDLSLTASNSIELLGNADELNGVVVKGAFITLNGRPT